MGRALKVAAGLAGAGLATGVALTTGAVAEARVGFALRRHTVPVLPPGSADVTVLQLSDFHFLPGMRAKARWVQRLRAAGPDLVITTGDNMSSPAALDTVLGALEPFLDLPGAFVFGSNDYHAPRFKNPLKYVVDGRSYAEKDPVELPWRSLRDKMTGVGWKNLMHHREVLEIKGSRLAFRGTDDAHLERDDYSLVAGPADADADVNIGVTHAPYARLLYAMTADGMDLILAGHTHGGQVCVPGHGALVTNCDLDTARVKGLSSHTAGGRTSALHVSAGVGTSPAAPYRFACRPEVTMLTLVPRDPVS